MQYPTKVNPGKSRWEKSDRGSRHFCHGLDPRLQWCFRYEISTYEGVSVKAHQVIITTVLRTEMLQQIHHAHLGPGSSTQRGTEAMFWPGMQAAIRETCQTCGTCAHNYIQRPVEPLQSHDIPVLPWSKVSR